ncbi:MAG TPA: antitoxin [Phenylobacterium sp.]
MSRRPVPSFDISPPRGERVDAPQPVEVDPPELTAAIEQGRADAAAGRVTPHAQVKAWLQRWGRGDPGPAPRPWKSLG